MPHAEADHQRALKSSLLVKTLGRLESLLFAGYHSNRSYRSFAIDRTLKPDAC